MLRLVLLFVDYLLHTVFSILWWHLLFFCVFPYLEARTENVTKNSPQKINSFTQASCTSCENKKKMKKKSPKSLRVGRILNNAALPSAAWLFLLFLYSRQQWIRHNFVVSSPLLHTRQFPHLIMISSKFDLNSCPPVLT